jgi:hypothetical protein
MSKNIILIFTHYYGDPNGDTEKELEYNLFFNLSKTIKETMTKAKIASNSVKFKDIYKIFC